MDITNDTADPVIVEAERGGPGNPPDPPHRYKLMKGEDKYYDSSQKGGAIRVAPGDKGDFPEVNGNQKLILYAFEEVSDYAGCRLAMKGDATGPGSYRLRPDGGGSYEIVDA